MTMLLVFMRWSLVDTESRFSLENVSEMLVRN